MFNLVRQPCFCQCNVVRCFFYSNQYKMEQYRIQEIAKSYPSFNPEIVSYGQQILYEMEMDLKAMKQAISYLSEYIKYRSEIKDTHTFGDNACNQALELLVKRVSEYSCPNNKKEKFKTKENCPLKENCKCIKSNVDNFIRK